MSTPTRVLVTTATPERVAPYLPSNFVVLGEYEGTTFIVGRDVAGWTVEDYVRPRLLSALITTEELS